MEKEVDELLSLFKQAKTVKESVRYHAVLLVKEGNTKSQVAKFFHVSEDTIRHWVIEWDTRKDVKDKERSGRPGKITKAIEKEICKLADENNPKKENMHCSSWDCHELRKWLWGKHKIIATEERIRVLLRKNGFSWRKMNYKFTKADDKKKEQFLTDFKLLQEELQEEPATLIFQDEMNSKLHPHQGYVWTREKKPIIETECSHKKTYLIGGVNADNGKTYEITNEKFNSKVFIEFLLMLLSSIKGIIYLVMDNHPSHRSKAVRQFLDTHPRIQALWLPEYSPEMNPKENFWNYVRKKFLNNQVFKTVEEMAVGVKEFINSIPKEVVKSVCSYDYLLG